MSKQTSLADLAILNLLEYGATILWAACAPTPRVTSYRGVALSGGAQLGFAHISYLQTLEHLCLMQDLKTIVGTSVGAVVAFLYVMGVALSDIAHAFSTMSMGDLINLSHFEHLKENYGLDTGEWLMAHIMMTLYQQGLDPQTTFRDLENRTGYDLVLVATQFDTNSTVYFRAATHPNMPIIKAVRCSVGLPLLFTLATYDGHSYVDGAFRDNFPLDWLRSYLPHEHRISGCLIIGNRPRPVTDALSYVYNLFVVMTSLVDPNEYRSRAVVSEILDVPMVAYTTTPENNRQCYTIAQLATIKHLLKPAE